MTRRRRFLSTSRHAETPRRLLLELNAEGGDYLPVPDPAEEEFSSSWATLRIVLEDAPQKLTRQDILELAEHRHVVALRDVGLGRRGPEGGRRSVQVAPSDEDAGALTQHRDVVVHPRES